MSCPKSERGSLPGPHKILWFSGTNIFSRTKKVSRGLRKLKKKNSSPQETVMVTASLRGTFRVSGKQNSLFLLGPVIIVHGPGQQNFQFLTTLGDKGYRIFLETLFTLLYLYV